MERRSLRMMREEIEAKSSNSYDRFIETAKPS
jgi:hypothetical protein